MSSGLDSLGAVELRNNLESSLSLKLSPTVVRGALHRCVLSVLCATNSISPTAGVRLPNRRSSVRLLDDSCLGIKGDCKAYPCLEEQPAITAVSCQPCLTASAA